MPIKYFLFINKINTIEDLWHIKMGNNFVDNLHSRFIEILNFHSYWQIWDLSFSLILKSRILTLFSHVKLKFKSGWCAFLGQVCCFDKIKMPKTNLRYIKQATKEGLFHFLGVLYAIWSNINTKAIVIIVI